jgi:hypothetical protein
VACGLVIGVLVQGTRSYAESGRTAVPHVAAIDASGASERSRAVPGAQDATAPLLPEQVVFSVEPLDAHVWQGGTDLGTGPFLFHVPAGHPVALELRRDGYKTEVVTLDGRQSRLGVKLVSSGPRPRTR